MMTAERHVPFSKTIIIPVREASNFVQFPVHNTQKMRPMKRVQFTGQKINKSGALTTMQSAL